MLQAIERLLATPKMIPVFPSSNAMTRSLALELRARPLSEIRAGVVCRFEKLHQIAGGIGRRAYRIVRQHELAQLIAVERGGRTHRSLRESLRFGIRVRVVRGIETHPARPETGARTFMRIGFLHHRIGQDSHGGMSGGTAAGKAR